MGHFRYLYQQWGVISPDFDFWTPRPWRPRCRCAGRPWGSAKNVSMTKAVAISPLKLLNGHPLGTATTLVGHGGRYYGHLYMLPRRPPRGHPRELLRGLYGRFEGSTRPIFRIKAFPHNADAAQINLRSHSNPRLVWIRPWGPPPEVLFT